LFTSGRILLGVRLAEINKRLAEQQLKSTRYASVYVVRQIILALLMAEASVELLQDMHDEMSRILDDTHKLEVQGMATTADVLEAQANLQFIEKTTADAISEQVHAREGLRLLVGATDDDPMRIAGSLEETNSKVGLLATSSDDAVALKRPEIRERELQLELAHKQVSLKQAEGIFRPTIALSLEGGLRGDRIPVAQSNWTMAWDNYYMAAIVLDLKLFDGGEAGSKADQAQAQAAQATLGLEQSRRMLSSEFRRARAQLQAQRSALQASDARVAEHSEKRRVAVQSFDAGAMGRSEYLAAHLKWSEARTSRLVALYELRLAELELEHAAALLPTTP
jgi:outer membrane protein TolC